MRFVIFADLFLVASLLSPASIANAEEQANTIVIAIDQPTAELWRRHHAAQNLVVLVRREDEPYEAINQRAHLIGQATCVLYRTDRSSVGSQFFRERIASRGVPCKDISALNRRVQRPQRRWRLLPEQQGIAEKECLNDVPQTWWKSALVAVAND